MIGNKHVPIELLGRDSVQAFVISSKLLCFARLDISEAAFMRPRHPDQGYDINYGVLCH